ncbi:hypothetical protein HRbin09_00566 [bacterium HR09]|nr:hypothetical protein HRbin09_00566 [bacterium HR09]
MCELLGLAFNEPVSVSVSFPGSRRRRERNPFCVTYRAAPFRTVTLRDEDRTVDLANVKNPSERGFVIVTTPLTKEDDGTEVVGGTLLVMRAGRVVYGSPRRDGRWMRGGS